MQPWKVPIILWFITDVFIGFEHTTYTVEESAGMIQLTVDIVGRTTRPISISHSTLDDTAIGEMLYYYIWQFIFIHIGITGGNDFQQRSEIVTVFPPDTQVVISVQIFPDNLLEGEERFSVFIASSDEHTTITRSTAQITIVDSSEGREHNSIILTYYNNTYILYCGLTKEDLGSPHSMK